MRDRDVPFGKAPLVGHKPCGKEHGEIGGSGGQPSLAQPVIQACGDLDGGSDGEEYIRERDMRDCSAWKCPMTTAADWQLPAGAGFRRGLGLGFTAMAGV